MQNRARALEKSDGNNVHLRATRADTRPCGGKGLEPHPGGEETSELPLTLLAPTGRPWETGPGDPGGDGPRSHLPRGQGSQQTCGGMAVIKDLRKTKQAGDARRGTETLRADPWGAITITPACGEQPAHSARTREGRVTLVRVRTQRGPHHHH